MTADERKVVTYTKPATHDISSCGGDPVPGAHGVSRSVSTSRDRRQYARFRNQTPVDQRVAVFEAFDGCSYACSPRAIYRAFLDQKRFADHQFIWALRAPIARALAARGYDVRGLGAARTDEDSEADLDLILGAEALDELRRAIIVVWGGEAYRRSYAQAGYWVSNSLLPDYLIPRRCQTLVQTWRGTPLRRFGCDVPEREDSRAIQDSFEFEGRRLTCLLSPSQYASEKFISAFCLGRKKRRSAIIQAGHPGTDALVTATVEQITAARKRLGLPADKKVALWSPSLSSNDLHAGVAVRPRPSLDIDALRGALGGDVVLLLRAGSAAHAAIDVSDGFARDVTAISDVNDLYLVSDVLVTDYSSAIFDYAQLRRPIILHLNEEERDATHDHGLYLDPRTLPARSAFSGHELIEAIRSAVTEGTEQTELLCDAFNERFNPLGDGGAAERALRRVVFEDPQVVPPPTFAHRMRRRVSRMAKKAKKAIKRALFSASRRSSTARFATRGLLGIKRHLNYRKHRRQRPVNSKMIIFESFVGWKYSCNPRALYEAALKDPRFDDFTLVWAFKDPDDYRNTPELRRATLVRYGSQEYYACHAEAKYWISNSVVFPHMKLREGQVYVQTWHGTPLKRLGCDIEIKPTSGVEFDPEEKRQWYEAEGRRFTFLLAQSPFAAKALESAFGLAASGRTDTVLQAGYPRNDFLLTYTEADTRRIRKQLDLPADKTIVLYAPTWRDDQHEAGVGYTLDIGVNFDALRRELGDTHVILFRAHYLIASVFRFESYEGFVRDVSQIDDINELYVASDMLVTDYSSVFFDYANLRRPILFYMYDLARYADQVRGFYLDLAELPGPIIERREDLAAAIRSAEPPTVETTRALNEFADRYTSLDDGHASERVLSAMLRSPGHKAAR